MNRIELSIGASRCQNVNHYKGEITLYCDDEKVNFECLLVNNRIIFEIKELSRNGVTIKNIPQPLYKKIKEGMIKAIKPDKILKKEIIKEELKLSKQEYRSFMKSSLLKQTEEVEVGQKPFGRKSRTEMIEQKPAVN